jgi:hypothetical protein
MENYSRKKVTEKMFEAALKEKLSELARKYDPGLILEIWTQILKGGGVKACVGKAEWNQKMTIEQALDCLDDYCSSIESLIKPHEGGKGKKKKGNGGNKGL